MSQYRMPAVVVRLLIGAALSGAIGAGTMPSGHMAAESTAAAAGALPTTNSFSGYIIAVG